MTGAQPYTEADRFRALSKTMWRINERHDLRTAPKPHNDNGVG